MAIAFVHQYLTRRPGTRSVRGTMKPDVQAPRPHRGARGADRVPSRRCKPLPAPVRSELEARRLARGLPGAALRPAAADRRLLGLRRRRARGQLVVNAARAPPLAKVFRQLYGCASRSTTWRSPTSTGRRETVRRTATSPARSSAGRRCRRPCTGGTGTGHWSMHAYGEAVDLNPVENPYVGCGMTRDKTALSVPRPLAPAARDGHAGGRRRRSRRSGGAGAAPGRARRRTTCTSPKAATNAAGQASVCPEREPAELIEADVRAALDQRDPLAGQPVAELQRRRQR